MKPKGFSAMQRLWLITLYLQQRLNCDSRHEINANNQFFAQVAGLKKLQQTQRDQVIDLTISGWLEVVEGTETNRQKYFRLTDWAEKKLEKVLKFNPRNAARLPKDIKKMGIQPTLFEVPQPSLSDISVSGEFEEETSEETFAAFWQETL